MKLMRPAMVTSPTGKGVILMGRNGTSKAMFELTDSMEWIPMEQTLQHDHYYPVPIQIPDDLVYEKDSNNEQK